MIKPIVIIATAFIILISTFSAEAQPKTKMHRIGVLSNAPKSNKAVSERIAQFRDELRKLGYVDGRNAEFHYRYPTSTSGRAAQQAVLAQELVALKPDVIFTFSSPATDSVQSTTRTIPVVVGVGVDRFVKDFSHPSGNITGLSSNSKDLIGKQLQIFRETLPNLKKVAVLWNPEHRAHPAFVKETKRAAATLGLQLVTVPAAKPAAFAAAFQRMSEEKVDGVLILRGGMFVSLRPRLSNLANVHGIPSMFGHPSEAQAGGLMSYGTNVEALFRRAATYVDKILKGAKPADLPAEWPTKFNLVINLKTAKKLGLVVPPSILLRANDVIE